MVLRDVDLASSEQKSESLLCRDSPDVDQFKTMKGLEHLAKLSIEDCELKMYTEPKN